MKSTKRTKITPRSTPQVHHLAAECPLPLPDDGVLDADTLFLLHVAKQAKLTAKDFQLVLRVNKTTAYSWWNGTKAHPLKRARDVVDMFREAGALHLIPSILEYIAGSDFDGSILTAEGRRALMALVNGITK